MAGNIPMSVPNTTTSTVSGTGQGQGEKLGTSEKVINFLCLLEDASNARSVLPIPNLAANPPANLAKLRVAMRNWTENLQTAERHKESRKVEIKDTKTEIYQMVGFYIVVQGVLFQGISSMDVQRIGSCQRIFWVSTVLSLLTSVATIGGLSLKLYDLHSCGNELSDAEALYEALHLLLQMLRRDGTSFNSWKVAELGPIAKESTRLQKKRSLYLLGFAVVVILLLVVFSIMFPYAFHVILCSTVEAIAPSPAPTPSN